MKGKDVVMLLIDLMRAEGEMVKSKKKGNARFDDANPAGQSTSSEFRRCHRLLPEAGSRAAGRADFVPSATSTSRAEPTLAGS